MLTYSLLAAVNDCVEADRIRKMVQTSKNRISYFKVTRNKSGFFVSF